MSKENSEKDEASAVSDLEQSYLLSLHKENTIMLNKALLFVPLVYSLLFLTQLSRDDATIVTFFMLLGVCCSMLSILFFLYSLLVSERAIDSLDEENGEDSIKLNYQVKILNALTVCLIFSSLLSGMISLFLKYL